MSWANSFCFISLQAMLLGAPKDDFMDRNFFVTVACNHFASGLVQRMPRSPWEHACGEQLQLGRTP
ncbi:hypothetical protein M758_1G009300 [Ceratodon purpureus]|nr:hypothetical protein M758_1G009300 [Ceratodon purpureus]